ncbi:MAG: hypothetical protein K0S14_2133 [Thermomicrobiales bacterium]|nr:hypothetical protein [Thermomicrobiales bacterium]
MRMYRSSESGDGRDFRLESGWELGDRHTGVRAARNAFPAGADAPACQIEIVEFL